MRKVSIVLLAALLAVPALAMGQSLEEQVKELQEELEYISERVDRTERHSATDRITFTGDFRTKADSLHYQDLTWSPGVAVDLDQFGADAQSGAFGNPADSTSPLGSFIAAYPNFAAAFQAGLLPSVGGFSMLGLDLGDKPAKDDLNNDILYTTRLRLNMKAKVYDNVNFAGRLSMYKNWGDSTGIQVFDSWNAFTMDGTNGGNTTGDWLRVERAYFNWKDIGGSDFYLSIGRRPSTYGPPTQYRENEMRGGTPSGHLVNFNFDGMTLGYKLGEITGVEGQVARFCYGQGFESQWGNGELYNDIATEDTHLGGFNLDLLNDGTNFLQLTAFAALDVVDGFKGTFAFPSQLMPLFAPTINQDAQNFPNMNFMVRYQPETVIGDIYLGGLGFAREEMSGVNYFASAGWTRLKSNGDAGMFGGMGSDELYQIEAVDQDGDGTNDALVPQGTGQVVDDSTQDGYSIYAGVQVPAPMGKLGLEYNYGSKYWTPFTQSQDDVLGSKLATRGHVGEAYYIFDVNPRMFIKLGGLYYDYEYTGSGSPVGTPHNVDNVLEGKEVSLLPVADTAWDANASLTINF